MPKQKWWEGPSLPFQITIKPTQKHIIHWFEDEDKHIDNESCEIILSQKGCSLSTIVFIVLWFFVFILNLLIDRSGFFNALKGSITLLILALLSFIYSLIRPTRKIVLYRFENKITYPSYLFYPDFTITFTMVKVFKVMILNGSFMPSGEVLKARNPFNSGIGKGNYELANAYPEEWWSFYVWYMDKNRPLPPGKAFDPYREKDFQRRKAEGFPKPLYPSNFKTPEVTKEQQAERKRIGGW